jgi:isopentenyldiphosphate isomerase
MDGPEPGQAPAQEWVDVVDEHDRVVGRAPRAEVRARNLLHRGVGIVVRNRDRVYVHRRTTTKDVFPGAYDPMIGGMVAAGEAYQVAAARELDEELGIRGVGLRHLFQHRYQGPANNCHVGVFEVEWDGPVRPQDDEIAWGTWMTIDEVCAALPGWDVVPDGAEIWWRWQQAQADARG